MECAVEPKVLNLRKMTHDLGKRETNRLLADMAVAARLAKTGQTPRVTPSTDTSRMIERGWLK